MSKIFQTLHAYVPPRCTTRHNSSRFGPCVAPFQLPCMVLYSDCGCLKCYLFHCTTAWRSIYFVWIYITFFCCGAATQRGSWPPHSWGFLDHTQRRSTVGRTPLDEWSARRRDLYLTNTQHPQQTNIYAPGGIRTHDLGRRAAADLRLRPRGHWDRQFDRIWNGYFWEQNT